MSTDDDGRWLELVTRKRFKVHFVSADFRFGELVGLTVTYVPRGTHSSSHNPHTILTQSTLDFEKPSGDNRGQGQDEHPKGASSQK